MDQTEAKEIFTPEFKKKFMELYQPERPLIWQEAEVLYNEIMNMAGAKHVDGISHIATVSRLLSLVMIRYKKMKEEELNNRQEA